MKYLKSYMEQSNLCNESIIQYLKPKPKEEIEKYKKELDDLPTKKRLHKIFDIGDYIIDLYSKEDIEKMFDEVSFHDKIYYLFSDDYSPFVKLYSKEELEKIKDYHWNKDLKDYEEFWGEKRIKL
jgi:hypothetical protein